MSDKQPDADPVLDHLRERENMLMGEIADLNSRLDEVRNVMAILSDGRSRVSKQRRQRATGNHMAAIDEVRGILRPDADAAAEQEGAAP